MYVEEAALQKGVAPHSHEGKGNISNMRFLRKNGPEVQDLLCFPRLFHIRPLAEKGTRKEKSLTVLHEDVRMSFMRKAQKNNQKEEIGIYGY